MIELKGSVLDHVAGGDGQVPVDSIPYDTSVIYDPGFYTGPTPEQLATQARADDSIQLTPP